MHRTVCPTVVMIVVSLLVAVPTRASLIGDTIHGFSHLNWDADAVIVDPGREFSLTSPNLSILYADFDADTLTIGFDSLGTSSAGGNNAFDFTDLDWVGMDGEITGLTLLSNNWNSPWTVNTTADSISISGLNGANFAVNGPNIAAIWHIDTTHIPAPGAALLAMIGLPMISWAKRRFA